MRKLRRRRRKIVGRQQIAPLGRPRARHGNQFRQIAITVDVPHQRQQGQGRTAVGLRQMKMRADDQRKTGPLGRRMGTHDARQRALVGNGQPLVPKLDGARHQLFRMRGPMQEAEIAQAVQLSILG
ncbi:hypothetical protein D3C85_889020 [compost metagenome]